MAKGLALLNNPMTYDESLAERVRLIPKSESVIWGSDSYPRGTVFNWTLQPSLDAHCLLPGDG